MRKAFSIAFCLFLILNIFSFNSISSKESNVDSLDENIENELKKYYIYVEKPGGESGLNDYIVIRKQNYNLNLERDSFFLIQDLEKMFNFPDLNLNFYAKKLKRLANFSENLIVRRYAISILRTNSSLIKHPKSYWYFLSLLKSNDSYKRQEALLFFLDHPFDPAFLVIKKLFKNYEKEMDVILKSNKDGNKISANIASKDNEMKLSFISLSRLKKGRILVQQKIAKQIIQLKSDIDKLLVTIPKTKKQFETHETVFYTLLPLKNKWLRKAKKWKEKARLKYYNSIVEHQFTKYFSITVKVKSTINPKTNSKQNKPSFMTYYFVSKTFIENLKTDIKNKGWGFWKKKCFSCYFKNSISKDEGKQNFYIGYYLWQSN